MKLIDRIRKLGTDRIFLARFHKHALGWFTGTRVFAVPCPPDERGHTEVFISHFSPDMWPYLWRLHIRTSDEPGRVAASLQALSESECNLLAMETLTTESKREHQILAFMQSDERYIMEDSAQFITPGYSKDKHYEIRRDQKAKVRIGERVREALNNDQTSVTIGQRLTSC